MLDKKTPGRLLRQDLAGEDLQELEDDGEGILECAEQLEKRISILSQN
jgi:hypothetical protein